MAEITTSQIGNGTTAYGSDIVVKDLDLDVSNRVKDDTPVLNMCMSKKRKVNSTLPLWTDDLYRLPSAQAVQEGAAVSTSNAESNKPLQPGQLHPDLPDHNRCQRHCSCCYAGWW
jgi:hypothetical protein